MTSLKMSNIFKDVTFHDSKKKISEGKKKNPKKFFLANIPKLSAKQYQVGRTSIFIWKFENTDFFVCFFCDLKNADIFKDVWFFWKSEGKFHHDKKIEKKIFCSKTKKN